MPLSSISYSEKVTRRKMFKKLGFLRRTASSRSLKVCFVGILCICVIGYVNNFIMVNVTSEWDMSGTFGGSVRLKRLLNEGHGIDISYTSKLKNRDILTFGSKELDTLQIPKVPRFVISPDKSTCDNKVDLLIYVQSSWSNFMRRRYIRYTWGGENTLLKYNVKTVFILGKPDDHNDQVKINNEHLLYGDILEADIKESFQNLSLKCVAALSWISNNCTDAKYIMKVDDDIFVNVFNVFNNVLSLIDSRRKFIICHVIENEKSPIVRDKASKWYIPPTIFPNRTHLPRFCSGYFAIMTKAVFADLYLHSKTTPLIAVDDVYLFGHLTQGIRDLYFVDVKRNLTLSHAVGLESYRAGNGDYVGINVQDSAIMEQLWSLTLSHVHSRIRRPHSKKYTATMDEENS